MDFSFKENLRNELTYQGITVKELSARTGIPIATLDCYLGTRATVPSVETAVKIAMALQVSVEYLAIGDATTTEMVQKISGREAQDLIHWFKDLSAEQRKVILKLIRVFEK